MATVFVPLKKGVMKVDLEDWLKYSGKSWWVISTGYAYGRPFGGKSGKLFHRLIMNEPEGMDIDHINGDKLDNRKNNLRVATRGQNSANQKPQRKKLSSKHKGVSWQKSNSKWYAYINKKGRRLNLGYYQNENDAAKAYNKKALEIFGEFALLNKVVED